MSASRAVAETVPLPRPSPKARPTITADARPSSQAPAPATGGALSAPVGNDPVPTPVIPDRRNRVSANGPQTFDAGQKALAARASAYLSSLQTLVGNFVQVGPDGSKTTGEFYIQKPGKIRFEYDETSPIMIVSDGKSVVVRDRKLATQDVYPLSQTPLRYLLSDKIDLIKDTSVVGISSDDMFITIIIEENQALIGKSRLMLMIGTQDNKLKQWTITDPQGYDTTVAVYNLDANQRLDPQMFKIDYTNYSTPKN